MLTIYIKGQTLWDERSQMFIDVNDTVIQLEHSLLSLSKWEAKHHKAYLKKGIKLTVEEKIDYLRCMTINKNVNPYAYYLLTEDQLNQISDYTNDPQTATVFMENKEPKHTSSFITSELIYYYMFSLNIPMECQKWHLNRLLTLIKLCNIKNSPPKKQSSESTIKQYAALNAARRKRMHSRG